MVARSRSVLQEQTVEVMEAVVWRCSLQVEGRPAAVQPNGCRTVRGGRLEVLAVRSMAVVWRRSLQAEGRPAAVQPNGCRTKGLEAANLEGLETGEVLEVEANLEVLESVGLEAAGGSNLEGLEAAVAASWWARRRLLIQLS
ncbi:unnamed protein product [Boreogadus saida]